MPRVLITGGTGVLGSALAPRFASAGYDVRIMSRRPARPDASTSAEWATADLSTGVQNIMTKFGVSAAEFATTEDQNTELLK